MISLIMRRLLGMRSRIFELTLSMNYCKENERIQIMLPHHASVRQEFIGINPGIFPRMRKSKRCEKFAVWRCAPFAIIVRRVHLSKFIQEPLSEFHNKHIIQRNNLRCAL